MFLKLLDNQEKKWFLELVDKVAKSDGDFAPEEQQLIILYMKELGLSEIPETSSIEELVLHFSESDEQIQKVVLFELYTLIMADGILASSERYVIEQMRECFTVDNNDIDDVLEISKRMQETYNDVCTILFQ